MRTIIFGVDKRGITIAVEGKHCGSAKTPEAFKQLMVKIKPNANDVVMFSSSMDFPREYTKNKTVLKMVEKLHGN